MNRKKILALALCAALTLSLLSGCAAAPAETTAPAETEAPAATEAPAETETPAATEAPAGDSGVVSDESLAQYQAIMDELKRVAGTYGQDLTVCTVDGEKVSWPMFFYLLYDELQTVLYYTGALPEDYGQQVTEDMTMGDYLKQSAFTKAKYYSVAHAKAAEEGASLSEEQEAELQAYWDKMVEDYGGEEAVEQALEDSFLTRDLFLYLMRCSQELGALMEKTYGSQGENLSEEDVLAWAADGEYMRVKHVLYQFYGDDGQPLDEAGKEEQRKRAEAALAELQALVGDDEALEARFDEIMKAESDDPGLERFPRGYVFTPGTMVTEYEDAAKALKEYGLSELVETAYGYHILLRLPLETDGLSMDQDANTGEYLTLRQSAANDRFARDLAAWIEAAEVEWTPGFEDLDLNALFGVGPDAKE